MRINREKMLARMRYDEEKNKRRGSVGFVETIKDGEEKKLRIVPAKSLLEFIRKNQNDPNAVYDADDVPYCDIYVHQNIGGRWQDKVYCPLQMKNEPCPICKVVEELKKSKNKDDVQLASKLALRHRIRFLVIDRDNESDGPLFFETSKDNGNIIIGYFNDSDYGNLDDPEEGYDIKVKRTGSNSKDTRYKITPRPMTSKLIENKEGEIDYETIFGWIEKMPNINDISKLRIFNADELTALLNGEVSLSDLYGSASEVSDEDEDEDEGTEEDTTEDEEPEEKPKVKLTAKSTIVRKVR